jgi:hypothetical protein
MREHLQFLARILREIGEATFAARIENVLSGSDADLEVFLVSNELWGGSGSVADEAGLVDGHRTDGSRRIQRALIQLGSEQIRLGKTNSRTETWVEAFKKWERAGI